MRWMSAGWMMTLMLAVAVALPAAAQPVLLPEVSLPTLDKAVREKLDAAMAHLSETGDLKAATQAIEPLWDQVVAYAHPTDDVKLFIDVAHARRLVRMLVAARPKDAKATAAYLVANTDLARALTFSLRPGDKEAKVLAVIDDLRAAHGDKVATYFNLAAAIALVHDEPMVRRINENAAKSPSPTELFDYFTKYESRMLMGIRSVPPELLVWVVDATGTIEEMQWALGKYAGDKQVGRRFFDIKYDYDHLRTGRPKKVTEVGFTLPNILQHGGVCADQAYFAAGVGKAIGVPTAYVVGRGSEMGHAWVGYFEVTRNSGRWNFDVGRYQDYKFIKGEIIDPQTRQRVADGDVAVLAELVGTSATDRHAAAALTDAAWRLSEASRVKSTWPPEPLYEAPKAGPPHRPRPATVEQQLAILEAGLRGSPGYRRGWEFLDALAISDELSLADKQRWAGILQRLCGQHYPDFALSVLKPMIKSVQNTQEQSQLWDSAFRMFPHRKDLAAEIRVLQAEMWEADLNVRAAGQCYEQVIQAFANDGPFVIDALQRTEKLLIESDMTSKIVPLYEQTWKRIQRPRDRAAAMFLRSSTWYRVGKLYADRVRQAGDENKAALIEKELQAFAG